MTDRNDPKRSAHSGEDHPRHEGPRETHHFHPDQQEHLRDSERLETIRFQSIMDELNVSVGDWVIDLGCGPGVFLPELSRIVGTSGRVLGADVSPRMIAHAAETIEEMVLDNTFLLLNSETEVPLRSGSFDRMLMVFLLHELTHPEAILKESRRLLKPGGRLLAIEWNKEPSEEGPPLEHRLPPSEVKQWFEDAGLVVTEIRDWTDQLYRIEATRDSTHRHHKRESEGSENT